MTRFWSGGQYSLFRLLFGLYLIVHFSYLLPWASEIFSNQGMISDASSSPLFGIIPNLLQINDSPLLVNLMVISALIASVGFSLGASDKLCGIWILYVLMCIFARNPLIANPALPYIGWMLLAHLFIPAKPFMAWSSRHDKQLAKQWEMPRSVYYAAVVILALSYSYSGFTKIASPSWVSGEAIGFVLQNPLAREYWISDFLLQLPPIFLSVLTWFILYVELLYAPIALIRGTHKWLWLGMLFVQFGFLFLLSFPDLTIAMLFFHLLTFDPRWVGTKEATKQEVVYFDGECGFCHGYIKLLLSESRDELFAFSPLQGQSLIDKTSAAERVNLPISMLVKTDTDELLMKSDAIIHCLNRLGGLWKLIAAVIYIFPKFVRDFMYDSFGIIRRYILAKPPSICPIMSPELAKRFID